MHMVSTDYLLARAVFARSIKVFKGQPGPRKPGITIFRKKKRPDFLEFVGPVTPLWVL